MVYVWTSYYVYEDCPWVDWKAFNSLITTLTLKAIPEDWKIYLAYKKIIWHQNCQWRVYKKKHK